MALTGTLLNNVSATGTGSVFSFDKPKSKFEFVLTSTGTNASWSYVEIDASIDGGSTYFLLENINFANTGWASPYSVEVSNAMATSIRANVTTLQSGVTNVTLEFAAED